MKYGVQLYSLREVVESKGLEEALKMVSLAGYDGVEFAGFYGHTPEEVKALLEKYNLEGVSAHIQAEGVEENLEYIKTLNIKTVFTAGLWYDHWYEENYPETVRKHKKVLDLLNGIGVGFGYHNHAHEYENGQDLVAKITNDVEGMKIEIDLCWATYAGRNVVETMRSYENKLETIHIKELPEGDPHSPPPPVGEGLVDMKGAIQEAKRQGLEWGILEVEGFNMPEFEYLSKSLENIKKIEKGENL
jgi:sugar phosphate isomerase/epimerase